MTEKLLVPDIGEFEGVEVIEILVQEGQEIKKNDPIVTIESDKSSEHKNKVCNTVSEAIQLTIDHLQEALNHSYRALTHSEMTYFEEHVMGFLPLE